MTTTLARKIGQMLVYGWQGKTAAEARGVNDHAAALIDDFSVGGLILMTRNADQPHQLRTVLQDMQERAADHGLPPLFVTIDQEGGKAARLAPPHFGQSSEAGLIGRSGDPSCAREAARLIGEELKSVGINWNFAPVLDVNNNPNNPIIGIRSYGSDPQLVAEMGVAAIQGYQEDAGIMACGKHFPGHGDTETDSHLALPTISHSKAHLDVTELVPFVAASKAGLAALMTSHILFEAVDHLPATLSHRILTDLLRREIGFKGIIITDCLEMNGIADNWDLGQAAVLAVEAGADMILCCHTLHRQHTIRDGLLRAVETGRISEARLDESLARIAAAKARWISPASATGARSGQVPELALR